MYSRKVLDKLVRLRNKDYKQLLERLDLKNVEEGSYDSYFINISCPFCNRYYYDKVSSSSETSFCASKCPFEQFGTEDCVGCINVMKSFMGIKEKATFNVILNVSTDYISWHSWNDKAVRKLLTTLRNELLKFKKEDK